MDVEEVPGSHLPSYADSVSAFHRCCAPALRGIVDELPITPGMRVLDAPCGDGTYLPWLRARVGPEGHVTGADASKGYLALAEQRVREAGANVELVRATIESLPRPFDFVWCAHSLYSLSDPATVLQALRSALSPGGLVGILENDSFHHWLLPWPVELELAVRRAQLAALVEKTRNWQKAFVGRNLAALLEEQGFEDIHVTTRSVDHRGPLSEDEQLVVTDYLEGLRALTWDHLEPAMRDAFTDFVRTAPTMPLFMGAHLEVIATARKAR